MRGSDLGNYTAGEVVRGIVVAVVLTIAVAWLCGLFGCTIRSETKIGPSWWMNKKPPPEVPDKSGREPGK